MKGAIYATCGHQIDGGWLGDERSSVIVKGVARDGSPAVSYEVRCPECVADLVYRGDGFATEVAALEWLRGASEARERP